MSCTQIYEQPSARVNRRMLLLHLRKLSCCCCVMVFSLFIPWSKAICDTNHRGYSNIELKLHSCVLKVLLLFSPIASLWCITVKGLEMFANRADDIINDKSGFFSVRALYLTSASLQCLLPVVWLWSPPTSWHGQKPFHRTLYKSFYM